MSRQSVLTGLYNYLNANLAQTGLGHIFKYFPKRVPEYNTATGILWLGNDSETREAFREKDLRYIARVIVAYPVAVTTDADMQGAQEALDGTYDKIKTLLRNDQTLAGSVLQAGEELLEVHNNDPVQEVDEESGELTGVVILGGYIEFTVHEFITA